MRLVRIQLCVSARSRFVCVFTESTRARTSSTRATHVDARTKSFGPRIRDTDLFIARPCLSFNSSRRSLRRAPARLVSRRREKRDGRPPAQRARAAEHARRAKRAHQRYAARRTDHFDVYSRHSYHLARPFSVRAHLGHHALRFLRSGMAFRSSRTRGTLDRTRRACPSRARWTSSARLPSRFRLADPIRAPSLPFSLRRSRSRRAALPTLAFAVLFAGVRVRARLHAKSISICRRAHENSSLVMKTLSAENSKTSCARIGGATRSMGTAAIVSGLGRSRKWWTPCRITCGRDAASGTCTREREMRGSKHEKSWRNAERRKVMTDLTDRTTHLFFSEQDCRGIARRQG